MKKIYTTDRLILKTIDESDGEKVLDYYLRNKDFLAEWEPIRTNEFYQLSFHTEHLVADQKEMDAGNYLRLWIFKKDNPEKIIGALAFSNIVRGCFFSCNLGYNLDEMEINQGYMTEAVQKGIEIIFGEYEMHRIEYGMHRIEANIMPKNARSLRMIEKLGFYQEGLAYNYLKINGRWEDHIHMVLRNKEMEIE
ncbi:MAG: Ribosomal-protein-alanine N-acetyltransferase [Lachnospiraceae bacterium]|nr:Ribosomal-protein-alanine N-acetyltransferase [Lachnospiraceae bacterium]